MLHDLAPWAPVRAVDAVRPQAAALLTVTALMAAALTLAGCVSGPEPAAGALEQPPDASRAPADSALDTGVLEGLEGEAPASTVPVFVGVSRGGLHTSALPGRAWMTRSGVDALSENRRAGILGWTIAQPSPVSSARRGRAGIVEGYADAVSVRSGEELGLHVSSSAPTFHVEVLRTGDYDGRWARRIWTSEDLPGGLRSGGRRDPVTRMVSADWPRSATLDTTGWPPGAYLAKLIGADGAASFVPFVVRDVDSRGAVLLVSGVATWQAYNDWGGPNTYRGHQKEDKAEDFELRSVAASFDRPYARGNGAGGFLTDELPAIAAAERLGLHLNYATDLDLHVHPEVLDGAVAVVVLGHSEYWSRQMRAQLTAARDRGVNLAFLGANDVHRRIRLTDSPLGAGRVMVNYKLGEDDPVTTVDTTADWGRPPHAQAQSSLVGPMFACAHSGGDLVIGDPDAWPFTGLGLAPGTRLPALIGPEYDRVNLKVTTPRPLQVLAHSPTTCRGTPDAADMTWYSAPSGAGVFAAGTLGWVSAMSDGDPLTTRVVIGVTERVLREVARPQAGARIPAQDNVSDYYTPDGALRGVGAVPTPSLRRGDDVVDPGA